MSNKIKILIADDHQIVRMGLTTIFAKEPDFDVVGEARNGVEAVRLTRELGPDIILMDLLMPNKNGADATAEILVANPSAKVLILTTFGESDEVRRAMDAGALRRAHQGHAIRKTRRIPPRRRQGQDRHQSRDSAEPLRAVRAAGALRPSAGDSPPCCRRPHVQGDRDPA